MVAHAKRAVVVFTLRALRGLELRQEAMHIQFRKRRDAGIAR